MSFIFRKFKMVLLLLLVAAYSYGQARDAKNFIITPQTVVKTNLPKLDSCLFKLQEILRERFGQSASSEGGGQAVIRLSNFGQILNWKVKNIIYSIYRQRNFPSEERRKKPFNTD